ncbi:hypothetical protein ABT071_13805 [Streptomyces sp. NPDC002506]|uniref:hypothetical protein n=1 Tax=Streptomyces sp. NPDC002506 TaxID=3154536 RepID=UPI00332FE48A
MTDRIPLDSLNSDQLDALYDERDRLRATVDRVHQLANRWAILRTHGSAAYDLRNTLSTPEET